MVNGDPMQRWGGTMKTFMESVPLPHLLKPTLVQEARAQASRSF